MVLLRFRPARREHHIEGLNDQSKRATTFQLLASTGIQGVEDATGETDGQPKPHFAKLVFSQLKNHLSSKAVSLTAKALSNYSLPVKSGTLLQVAKGVEKRKYMQQL